MRKIAHFSWSCFLFTNISSSNIFVPLKLVDIFQRLLLLTNGEHSLHLDMWWYRFSLALSFYPSFMLKSWHGGTRRTLCVCVCFFYDLFAWFIHFIFRSCIQYDWGYLARRIEFLNRTAQVFKLMNNWIERERVRVNAHVSPVYIRFRLSKPYSEL